MSLEALHRRRLELALSYGVDLPNPKPLPLDAPGFALGRCYRALFTPSGDHIVTVGANGTFLWDVVQRTKLKKLPAPSNPSELCFSADGSELLLRNESSKFIRVSLPAGEVVSHFMAKHPYRLEGCGTFGPDQTVLQLAHGGVLLQLDGSNGKVLFKHQLESNCYSGEVHWNVDAGEVIVAQTGMADGERLARPSAIWRFRLPLGSEKPERFHRSWIYLHTELQRRQGRLITHFNTGVPDRYAIEVLDLKTLSVIERFACNGGIVPRPALSHDGRSWGVSADSSLQLGLNGAVVDLPGSGFASFHPSQDLLAVSGDAGFVASTGQVEALLPSLRLVQDEQELSQRGYGRMMTLPGRLMPPRLIVFKVSDGFVVQPEREVGRKYLPIEGAHFACSENPAELGAALERGLVMARSASIAEHLREEKGRDFLTSNVSAPQSDCSACVAVAFASDAIDIWPMKSDRKKGFCQHWYPVAAIEPRLRGAELGSAVISMLGYYRGRR